MHLRPHTAKLSMHLRPHTAKLSMHLRPSSQFRHIEGRDKAHEIVSKTFIKMIGQAISDCEPSFFITRHCAPFPTTLQSVSGNVGVQQSETAKQAIFRETF